MSSERIGGRATSAPTPKARPDQFSMLTSNEREEYALPRLNMDAFKASAVPTRDVRDFEKFIQDQGNTNGCGTTSLAAMLSFWKNQPEAYTRSQIDKAIRFGPDSLSFTSPEKIEQFAKDEGFRSKAINGGSVDELKQYLDKGVPVQVLYDPNADGSDLALHYVNVIGYSADADGKVTDIQIGDPATGRTATMSRETFEDRWSSLHLKGVKTGLNNVMLVTLPGENTPIRGRNGQTTMSDDIDLPKGGLGFSGFVADKISDAINSLNPIGKARRAWNKLFG